MALPLPLPEPEPTATDVFLLHPQQIAWVRAHGGRRGASAFMRRLLAQLIEEERQEIARLQRQLREQRDAQHRAHQAREQQRREQQGVEPHPIAS